MTESAIPARRSRTPEMAVKLWKALKRAGDAGLTVIDAAERTGASAVYARKTMRAWSKVGLAAYHAPETIKRDDAGRYVMEADAPAMPPIVHTAGTVELREKPAMSPKQLAAIRRKLGLSLAQMASALGWAGQQPSRSRAMRRFENGERPIDAALAAKITALAKPEPASP